MNTTTRTLILAGTAALLAPTMAMAHPGHDAGHDFAAGVMHPLGGLDHLLMIVAVSAWAAWLKPTGRVVVAASLMLFVAIGALIPVTPVSGLALESAIALTVVGAGTLLAFGRAWPTWASAVLAATFALIHGFAHGAEGPAGSIAYVPGLATATGGLALAVSFLAAQLPSHRGWLRAAGVVSAATGVALLG